MRVPFCLGVFHEVALGWQLELEKKGAAAASSFLGLLCTLLGFVSVISHGLFALPHSMEALELCTSAPVNRRLASFPFVT